MLDPLEFVTSGGAKGHGEGRDGGGAKPFAPDSRGHLGARLRVAAHGHLLRDDPRAPAGVPGHRPRRVDGAVGFIEGVAEATASITKVFSGALSDWLGKRKLLAVLGYGLAAMTKPLFPLAASIAWLVAARFVDRVGKGIRGAPRDALVADSRRPSCAARPTACASRSTRSAPSRAAARDRADAATGGDFRSCSGSP